MVNRLARAILIESRFDDFKVKYYDGTGSELKASFVPAPGPISTGEWYTMDVNPNVWNTHWVDWSSLLDAPAGKYGHVKAKGDDFYFENGKRAKFWGVNIVAKDNFLSKERAIETAERLAKMGCNVARLHHLDAVWSNPNIFGNKESDTRTINLEMMDRVDFFVNELKKRGIYVYLDLLVHRQFKLGDGVIAVPQEDGAKQVGHFDEKLIELQKEYASQLLSHKNKYTGFTYADEPAVMGSIIINESTMFFYFNGDVMNSQYRDNLQKKFEQFTGRPDLKLAVFAFNYGVYGGMEVVKGSPEEVSKTIEFYKKIEYDYYETMASYMKNDLGAKFPIAGSNFPLPQTTYQEVNAMAKGLDFVATNNYWDHPKVFLLNNDWSRQLYAPIDNQSLIKNPARSLSNHFSKYAVNNKPFMVTEYNACFPNEWRLESPPMVSMYAALQGIDGLCQFDFRVEPVGNQLMSQAFSLSKQPDQLGGWVVAAPIMLGDGYITEATSKIVDPVSEKERNEFPTYNDFYDKNPHLTFITKVQSSYDGTSMGNVSSFDKYVDKESSVITSETGELSINSKVGLLLSKAPKVQGVTGALGELVLDEKGTVLSITPRKFDLPFFSVEAKNMWGSVNIVSKDGLPLEQSKNFYIVAVLPCRQTGMVFNDQRTQVDKLGNVPWEAQIFDGTVTLNRTGNMKIVPKTINGKDMAPIKGDQINGKTVIDMSKGRSYVYEVTIQ